MISLVRSMTKKEEVNGSDQLEQDRSTRPNRSRSESVRIMQCRRHRTWSMLVRDMNRCHEESYISPHPPKVHPPKTWTCINVRDDVREKERKKATLQERSPPPPPPPPPLPPPGFKVIDTVNCLPIHVCVYIYVIDQVITTRYRSSSVGTSTNLLCGVWVWVCVLNLARACLQLKSVSETKIHRPAAGTIGD